MTEGNVLPGSNPEEPVNETVRVEAFSDAVFAIAITLLGLELKVPHLNPVTAEGFWRGILALWPSYVAFVTSFATILIMWINHHGILKQTRRTDTAFMMANGLLLMLITAVPFSTACLANFLTTPAAQMAAGLYAGTFALINIAYLLLWLASAHHKRLLHAHISERHARRITRTLLAALPLYLMAMGVAVANPYASVVLCAALLPVWAVISYDYRPPPETVKSGPRRIRIGPWHRPPPGPAPPEPATEPDALPPAAS
ncbi:MAG: DUF1211 domain-containing protein [Candidatus Sericytochromatia bacterium]|nr:DUF1211 domain-containing protein [Candidatus Sericytochromatia bacterium]